MKLKFKNIGINFKIASEDDKVARVKAYVSIFNNVDYANEVIVKGAFTKSLAKKLPKVVWSHNWDLPIGKVVNAVEDDKGLLVDMEILKTVEKGREAYELLKNGAIDEFSIGYTVLSAEEKVLEGKTVLYLTELSLHEVSPVLVGCNPETELLDVKKANTKSDEEPKEEGTEEVEEVEEKEEEPAEEVEEVEEMVDIDEKCVKIVLKNGKSIVLGKNIIENYLNSKKDLGVKVDSKQDRKKVVLIRKALKQSAKANEYALREIKKFRLK